MTKADYLNTASDLRRIADWVARGEREKIDTIIKLWKEINKKEEVRKIIAAYMGKFEPQGVFEDDRKRIFFAEQALISSFRLQHISE